MAKSNKKQMNIAEIDSLKALSETVGDFIRYWGFRRIHGQIWTQLYLSQIPMSGAQLTRRLKVSKALVSPALSELEKYGLILSQVLDGKTKGYTAETEVMKVIQKILKTRERILLKNAHDRFKNLEKIIESTSSADSSIDKNRFASLGQMIETASDALEFILLNYNDENILNPEFKIPRSIG